MRVCSVPMIRRRIAPYLEHLPPSTRYSPTGTGLDQRAEFRVLRRHGVLKDASALIVGVGGGDDILAHWLHLGLSRVTAIDLTNDIDYKETVGWAAVTASAAKAGLPVSFAVADGTTLPFRDATFDFVYSISVLEHVPDISRLFGELHRVLRPRGALYSLFGPMWFTHGGPHIAALGYDHLLLPYKQFLLRVREVGDPWQIRWAEQHFYNRLTLEGYLEEFNRYFSIVR